MAGDMWLRQRLMCSTPYGITAEVTVLFEDRWIALAQCSTPYGITAEVTSGPWLTPLRPHVLNALRHHGGGHSISGFMIMT